MKLSKFKSNITNSKNFITGSRVSNKSIEIFKYDYNRFLVIEKKYFLGFPFITDQCIVDHLESAEDYIRQLSLNNF